MELRPLEHGAQNLHGILQLAVGPAVHGGRAGGGQSEAEQRAQGGRLAGAVRAEEAEHAAGLGLEAQSVDRERRPEPLGERVDLEHRYPGAIVSGAP
jgi:hypothetical protein